MSSTQRQAHARRRRHLRRRQPPLATRAALMPSRPPLDRPLALLQLWAGFVHAFVDALHAQGPAASRPPHAQPGGSHPPQPPLALPAVPRLVAVGDLHGDLGKARRAFRLAGLIDAQDRWAGGTTTVVQVRGCSRCGRQRRLQQVSWLKTAFEGSFLAFWQLLLLVAAICTVQPMPTGPQSPALLLVALTVRWATCWTEGTTSWRCSSGWSGCSGRRRRRGEPSTC